MLSVFDGVYAATERFGNPVVVIPTVAGNADGNLVATLGIFSSEHDAFASSTRAASSKEPARPR